MCLKNFKKVVEIWLRKTFGCANILSNVNRRATMAQSVVKLKKVILLATASVAKIVFSSFDECRFPSIDSEIA